MAYLALYGFTGFDRDKFSAFADIIAGLKDVKVVLLEDGVIGCNLPEDKSPFKMPPSVTAVYCLEEDMKARGLEAPGRKDFEPINYERLIDEIEKADKLICWL